VTAEGFNWKRGAVVIPWESVVAFDVQRRTAGDTTTAGGRSIFAYPPTIPDNWSTATSALAGRYPEAKSQLIVETAEGVGVFLTVAEIDRVAAALRPTITYYGI
jgi:hypothetical protein